MSWFNTSGFANLAKNALSQAQKTIDRALDIHDGSDRHSVPVPTKKTNDEADFFAAFGLEDSNNPSISSSSKKNKSPSNQETNVNSGILWGSFSGSFFDSGTGSGDMNLNSPNSTQLSQKTIASQPKASSSSSLPTTSLSNKASVCTDTSVCDTNKDNVDEEKSIKNQMLGSQGFSKVLSTPEDKKESITDETTETVLQRTSRDDVEKSTVLPELVSKDSELVEISLNSESDTFNKIDNHNNDNLNQKLESSLLAESFLNVSPDSPRDKSELETKSLQPEEKSSGESVIVLTENPCSVSASSEFLIIDSAAATEKGSSKPEKSNEAVLLEFDGTESLEKSTDSSETLKDSIDAEDIPTDQPESIQLTTKIQKEWGWGWESGLSASMTQSELGSIDNNQDKSVHSHDSENAINHPATVSELDPNSELCHLQNKSGDYSISHEDLPKSDSFTSDNGTENDFSKPSQVIAADSSPPHSENENQKDFEEIKELKEVKDSESKSTDSVISISSSSSSFVKCMIEEAIGDDAPRSHSPHSTTSSSEKSDMVKMESEQNSGHTSGDEVETTTSSDIEIISSPNTEMLDRLSLSPVKQIWPVKTSQAMRFRRAESPASDTSSARESPMAKRPRAEENTTSVGKHTKQRFTTTKTMGIHQRKSSEASSEDLENTPTDTDTLMKKVAEMTEVLKARESKLLELSHENISLQETNENLMSQLHQAEEKYAADSRDVTSLTEELSHRLATMERNLQQALREKETLQKELQQTKEDMANKVCAKQVEETIKEKDTQIQELLQEGEKLSKQQLQQSNIIKKLRVKEKENENLIKQQKEKLEEQSKELERARKSVSAKEDIERKQIDAIRQLTNTVQKQEKELSILRSDLEDALEKEKSMKAALDNSYKEISELHRANAEKDSKVQEATLSAEMVAKEELRDTLEKFRRDALLEQERLAAQIEDYQISLSRTETIASRREEALKQEIADLQQRLQEAETRNQELTQSVSSATRPLLRQIDNLQTTFSGQATAWEKLEKHLTDRLTEAQAQLTNATEKERSTMEKYIETSSRISSLESQNSALRQEKTRLQAQFETVQAKLEIIEDTKTKESVQLENLKESFAEEIKSLKREKQILDHQLEIEKTVVEAEKRKVVILQDQLKEKERKLSQLPLECSSRNSPSPTLSISRFSSVSESFNPWIQDDLLEQSVLLSSTNGSRLNLYDSIKNSGATSVLEGLQSQLKMREGEINQLQNEITKLERVRESMTQELVKAIGESDEINEEVKRLRGVKTEYEDMQQKYNALLQMYGEKVEEAEELKLDLLDVKEMYKAQIDGLLQR